MAPSATAMSQPAYIATWIHADSLEHESHYYQLGGRSSAFAFQKVYWRCVVTFFATSLRNNPEAHHVLFTNVAEVPSFDGFDTPAFLDAHGIEIVRLPLRHLTPPGYHGAWRNQFYIFDVIDYLAERAAPDEAWVVLDSDCVWVESGAAMTDAIRRFGLLTYALPYPLDMDLNGLTRYDMQALFAQLDGADQPYPPLYYGGEIFAATGTAMRQVAAEAAPLWDTLMRRFEARQSYFTEEAHALSYLYHRLGYAPGTANAFIRRIWTGLPLQTHNAHADDHALLVWHLPLEKRYGLRRLFEAVQKPGSDFWATPAGAPFRAYLGRHLGIPQRSPAKLAADMAIWLSGKLRLRTG